MAQSGIPVPAEEARLPLFTSIYADIGDAQSIERDLSSFSAHVVNLDRISREATADSLVLLDELGSATDPEEGAALAVAIASHFLAIRCLVLHHHSPHLAQGLRGQPPWRPQRRRRLRPADPHSDLRAAPRRPRSLRRPQHRPASRPTDRRSSPRPAPR